MDHAAGPSPSRLRLRWAARCGALAAAVALLAPFVPWTALRVIVPAASPFVAVSSAIAARAVGATALVGLPILVVSVVVRRGFCRWACPVGLVSEALGRVRRKAAGGAARLPPIGQGIVLLTVGGALLGYPVLLWLDPLAILSGFFGAWHRPVSVASAVASAGLPLVALVSLLVPHAWCGRLCPLGGMQDLLAVPRRFLGLARRGGGAEEKPAASSAAGWGLGRRAALGLVAGAAWAAVTRAVRGGATGPLRPPGAAAEDRFVGMCVRCGQCVRACPSGILRPDLGASGAAGWLTPVVVFGRDYCREDCRVCQAVCPTGAIARLSPEAKRRWVMGEARVDLAACLLAAGRECSACMVACPYEAVERVPTDNGFSSQPRVDLASCTGCGACEAACPTAPRKAIRIVPPAAAGVPQSGPGAACVSHGARRAV